MPQAGPRFSKEQEAIPSTRLGTSGQLQRDTGGIPSSPGWLLGSCLPAGLLTSGEHGHSPALCPLQPVASFPFISVASEVKCFQYFPPFFLSQHTTFILPSTRLFQGSMGHQNDELVPVVTVALSIIADIPGGHMSPKDSSRLGNSTPRLKLSFAMRPPQSTRPAVQAGPSQSCKDPPELLESSRDTSTGYENMEQSTHLHLGYCCF